MIERSEITGIVLCGGAGQRMHGHDKPLQELAGRPLVAHVIERLAPQVNRVVISCNRNEDRYRSWNDVVVIDEVADQGPLQGLLTALQYIDTPYAFVCPGDAPLLSTSLVGTLSQAWSSAGLDVCVPHDGDRAQHLFILLRKTVRDRLRIYLESGGRSVHGWIDTMSTRTVDVSAVKDSFVNVNSDADLRSVTAILARTQHR